MVQTDAMNSVVKFGLFFSLSYSVKYNFKTATCNDNLCVYNIPKFLLALVEGLLYKPKYQANLFYSAFFLFLLPSLLLAQFTVYHLVSKEFY